MKLLLLLLGVIVLLGVAEGSLLKGLVEDQLKSKSQSNAQKGCSLDVFKQYNLTTDCDGTSVDDGEECRIQTNYLNLTEVAHCEDGQWIRGTTTSVVERHKRFVFLIPFIICLVLCNKSKKSKPPKPPRYTNCPPIKDGSVFEAEEGKTSKVIRWSTPTATDDDGIIRRIIELHQTQPNMNNTEDPETPCIPLMQQNLLRHRLMQHFTKVGGNGELNEQTSIPENGQSFQGSKEGQRYKIEYRAKDNDGLSATCSFNIKVKVRHCNTLAYPSNGKRICDKGTIYGSKCTYSCYTGYQLTHDAVSKCQYNGNWSVTSSCKKVKCRQPPTVANGRYKCQDPSYSYLSQCFLNCNTGFTLQGRGTAQCQADKKWNLFGTSSCIDAESPTFAECTTPQIFYADFGVLNTSVTWKIPKASDVVDPNPTIQQVSGPLQGDVLAVGSHKVKYTATDASGNISPTCVIELRVQEITCDDPRSEFGENRMIPDCTDSKYYYGVSCDLSCDYKLPLNGSSSITCNKTMMNGVPVGTWDWGQGLQPHCVEVTCPELDPPINGALAHDSINQRPLVIVMCNSDYDIPVIPRFHGYIVCLDSGNWMPMNKTPDCTETRDPSKLRLPSEIYYYSGECGNDTTIETIKNNFLEIVASIVNPLFKNICPSNITCVVENVRVECGPTTRKKRSMENKHIRVKRSESHATKLLFDIVTDIQKGNKSFTEALNDTNELQKLQKEAFRSLISNHTLDVDGQTIREDSFQTALRGSFSCKRGEALDGNVCKPCPPGMYVDDDEKACLDCPFGFYQDIQGETSCKRCPSGYSTLQTRSKQELNCTKLCRPGSVSSTSMEPCTPCAIGSYQDSQGQTKCLKCPKGQTTASVGQNNVIQCQNFDVLVRYTSGDKLLGTMSSNTSFSVMFWARLLSENAVSQASFKLKVAESYLFIIKMDPTIAVQWGNEFQTNVNVSTARWNHVTVVWNDTRSKLKVYVDGRIEVDEPVVPSSFERGSFVIESPGSEGIYVSGLHVIERALDLTDLAAFLTTCTKHLDGSAISIDDFVKRRNSGIQVVTPSICDAIDECASSPCGEHKCINGAGDYRCVCFNDRSGRNCEITPDYCVDNDCKNGATCRNQKTNYTCTCKIGYYGDFCEVPPVNGGWSPWTDWSQCSASCGGGEMFRSRKCDSPAPGLGGRNCSGPYVQTRICNPEKCRECGRPWRRYGIVPNCTAEQDMNYCNPYCRNGTVMPMGVYRFDVYSCGPNTNFTWIPFKKFPDCVDPSPPRRYSLDVAIDYNAPIPADDNSRVETKIRNNLQKTECSNLASCEMNIALDKFQKRQKRSVGSTLEISMTVPIAHTGDLDAEFYFNNGTVSEGLQEIVDAVVTLELTAANIQANTSELLSVQEDGLSYTVDESSLVVSGESECLDGQVETEGLCTECPIGTRSVDGECGYCDIGSYQDETGQSFCKQCPVGFTTETVGAESISECLKVLNEEPESSSSTVATPKFQPAPTADAKFSIGMVVGISIGCVVAVVFVIVIVGIIYRRRTGANKKFVFWSKSYGPEKDDCQALGHRGDSSKRNVYKELHVHNDRNNQGNRVRGNQLGVTFSNSAYDCMATAD